MNVQNTEKFGFTRNFFCMISATEFRLCQKNSPWRGRISASLLLRIGSSLLALLYIIKIPRDLITRSFKLIRIITDAPTPIEKLKSSLRALRGIGIVLFGAAVKITIISIYIIAPELSWFIPLNRAMKCFYLIEKIYSDARFQSQQPSLQEEFQFIKKNIEKMGFYPHFQFRITREIYCTKPDLDEKIYDRTFFLALSLSNIKNYAQCFLKNRQAQDALLQEVNALHNQQDAAANKESFLLPERSTSFHTAATQSLIEALSRVNQEVIDRCWFLKTEVLSMDLEYYSFVIRASIYQFIADFIVVENGTPVIKFAEKCCLFDSTIPNLVSSPFQNSGRVIALCLVRKQIEEIYGLVGSNLKNECDAYIKAFFLHAEPAVEDDKENFLTGDFPYLFSYAKLSEEQKSVLKNELHSSESENFPELLSESITYKQLPEELKKELIEEVSEQLESNRTKKNRQKAFISTALHQEVSIEVQKVVQEKVKQLETDICTYFKEFFEDLTLRRKPWIGLDYRALKKAQFYQ
ncbi:MAG: hypothetical protein QRY74_00010 [Chlamydia sp.]